MAVLAGHAVKVSVATSNAAGTELDGINNIDWGPARDLLETTDFADTTAVRTRIAGLKDIKVSLSGDYESADTAQGYLRTAYDDGSSVWVNFLPNGSAGFRVECKVDGFSITAAFDGKVEFSCSLQGTGAIAAV